MTTKMKRGTKTKVKEPIPASEAQSTPGHPIDTVVDIVDTGEPLEHVAVGDDSTIPEAADFCTCGWHNPDFLSCSRCGKDIFTSEVVTEESPDLTIANLDITVDAMQREIDAAREAYLAEATDAPCGTCRGKGFIEYHHGLLQVGCDACESTGKAKRLKAEP